MAVGNPQPADKEEEDVDDKTAKIQKQKLNVTYA